VPSGRYQISTDGDRGALEFGSTMHAAFEDHAKARLDAAGDTLRTITRERAPLPYPDELWEDVVAPYRELMREQPGTRCDPGAPERPRNRAVLRHMLFDDEGRLWVEAATEDGFAWDVFDREGRLLGTAPAPARAGGVPPYARNGHLYQVETDEMDVHYVAVYRVIP
jgi:hypothetical protein